MVSIQSFVIIYLLGGVTFIPVVIVIGLFFMRTSRRRANNKYPTEPYQGVKAGGHKNGWIHLASEFKIGGGGIKESFIASSLQLYPNGKSKRPKGLYYGELRNSALFCYESEKKEICKLIIPVHNYTVSIYPESCGDADVFGRLRSVCLQPKRLPGMASKASAPNILNIDMDEDLNNTEQDEFTTDQILYLSCNRAIDKEDWYLGLQCAAMSDLQLGETDLSERISFDSIAMKSLFSATKRDQQTQWLNAILGRLFLGLYKTDDIKKLIEAKIIKKTKRLNNSFLDDISVRHVDVGHALPCFSKPRLLTLGDDASLIAEGYLTYTGGLEVTVSAMLNLNYSKHIKPFRVKVEMTLKLHKLAGKFMVRIKPPPSNRIWFGFYEIPDMDWQVTPIVSDKNITLSTITNFVESKIRESLAESMVLPNMDDIPFFDADSVGGNFGHKKDTNSDTNSDTKLDTLVTPASDDNKGKHELFPADIAVARVEPKDTDKAIFPPTRTPGQVGLRLRLLQCTRPLGRFK